ncbi:DUF5811 family protein [Halobaculum sp. CBA1158]|uniref:DUF5811 family protein n=1 Tax=Halobaculum sp. CBA1158 TaxID=2904243 RepID=UPI001F2666CF|nr:DUF5811 family protein [Halobaculum sp. CBA1158]UIO99611.1 DUF5811 family protein [Halobaculum sp. CBA1158]
MNGNNPYAGAPGVVDAGRPEEVDLTTDQKDALRRAVANIVTRTESYLPDGYAVGSELSYGSGGPEATVAVRPPVGHPVSAGFAPDIEDVESGLDAEDREEVARGLAASAAAQVMSAVGDDLEPTAR